MTSSLNPKAWVQSLIFSVVALATLTSPLVGKAQQSAAPAASGPQEADANVWRLNRQGYFWYIDPPKEAAPVEKKPEPSKAPAEPMDSDLKAFEAFKVLLEKSMNAATQNPSPQNVARFLNLYGEARGKARAFSDAAQTMAVSMPWIDPTFAGVRPIQPNAMRAYDMVAMQDRDQTIKEMSSSYGLYFFFRGNCAYCHVLAPMLQQFAQKYGFTVLPVSMDGSKLDEFPNSRVDNGLAGQIAESLGIPTQHFVVPAVILAKPSTKDVVPVGFGAMTMEEMADRIAGVVRVRGQGAGRPARTAISALVGDADNETSELIHDAALAR